MSIKQLTAMFGKGKNVTLTQRKNGVLLQQMHCWATAMQGCSGHEIKHGKKKAIYFVQSTLFSDASNVPMVPLFHGSNDLFRRRRAARSRNANTSSDAVKVVDGCSSWPALTVGISAPSALTLAPAMPPYDVINQYSRYTVSWTTCITLFIILTRKR